MTDEQEEVEIDPATLCAYCDKVLDENGDCPDLDCEYWSDDLEEDEEGAE